MVLRAGEREGAEAGARSGAESAERSGGSDAFDAAEVGFGMFILFCCGVYCWKALDKYEDESVQERFESIYELEDHPRTLHRPFSIY